MNKSVVRLLMGICFFIGGIVFLMKKEVIYSVVFFVVAIVYIVSRGKRDVN